MWVRMVRASVSWEWPRGRAKVNVVLAKVAAVGAPCRMAVCRRLRWMPTCRGEISTLGGWGSEGKVWEGWASSTVMVLSVAEDVDAGGRVEGASGSATRTSGGAGGGGGGWAGGDSGPRAGGGGGGGGGGGRGKADNGGGLRQIVACRDGAGPDNSNKAKEAPGRAGR